MQGHGTGIAPRPGTERAPLPHARTSGCMQSVINTAQAPPFPPHPDARMEMARCSCAVMGMLVRSWCRAAASSTLQEDQSVERSTVAPVPGATHRCVALNGTASSQPARQQLHPSPAQPAHLLFREASGRCSKREVGASTAAALAGAGASRSAGLAGAAALAGGATGRRAATCAAAAVSRSRPPAFSLSSAGGRAFLAAFLLPPPASACKGRMRARTRSTKARREGKGRQAKLRTDQPHPFHGASEPCQSTRALQWRTCLERLAGFASCAASCRQGKIQSQE